MTPRAALTVFATILVPSALIAAAVYHFQEPGVPERSDGGPAAAGADPRVALVAATSEGAPILGGRSAEAAVDTASARTVPKASWLPTAGFSADDAERLRFLNGILDLEGKAKVPFGAKIRSSDLDVFRAVVDDANNAVDSAMNGWRAIANRRSAELERELHARIRRGETEGLPYKDASNRMKRNHPYEAITQVVCEAGTFVLRVPVDENPRLREAGESLDYAMRRRVLEFETLVRPLFKTGESQ